MVKQQRGRYPRLVTGQLTGITGRIRLNYMWLITTTDTMMLITRIPNIQVKAMQDLAHLISLRTQRLQVSPSYQKYIRVIRAQVGNLSYALHAITLRPPNTTALTTTLCGLIRNLSSDKNTPTQPIPERPT